MVAGQSGNIKVGAIVQARANSSRLPGKVLMPLPFDGGKPLLKWVTDAVLRSKYVNDVIIATANETDNSSIVDFARENNIPFFCGAEDDVLSRFIHLAEQHRLDVVVRLTGDNPFIDAASLDKVIEAHLETGNVYTKSVGLPLGMNFEVISGAGILSLKGLPLSAVETEHVTPYFINNPACKKSIVSLGNDIISNIRLTVDYPSDFATASLLAALIGDDSDILSVIEQAVHKYPWIFDINAGNTQKRFFDTEEEELGHAQNILKQLELHRAANRLA